MHISIDSEKLMTKNPISFMKTEKTKQTKKEDAYFIILKAIACQTYAQHHPNWRTQSISLKVSKKTGAATFSTLYLVLIH